MTDDELPVLLLTCSGISHTGELTTVTGRYIRRMYPALISRHPALTGLRRPPGEELDGDECLIVVDRCDQCCAMKRVLQLGKVMDEHIVATTKGIARRGVEEPRVEEIQRPSLSIVRIMEKDGQQYPGELPADGHE